MPKKRYWVYFALLSLISINYVDRVALSVAAKPIAAEFGLSPVKLGYLFSSFLWVYFCMLVPMGMAADRFGTRRVAGLGMVVWSFATIATGFAPSLFAIMCSRLVMGAGEATSYPSAGRILREWVPRRERGFATSIMNSGSYAGPALGALFISWLVANFGWRMGFIISGALGFIWIVAWFKWYDRPEKVSFLSQQEQSYILTNRDAGVEAMASSGGGQGLMLLLRSQTMWGLCLTIGCAVYTQYLFLTWLPSYLENEKHITILKTGMFTALPYAIAAVLCVVFAGLTDRALHTTGVHSGRRRIFIVIAMLSAAVVMCTPLVSNIWLILALFTISLTGLATGISLINALANDMLGSPQDAGKAISLLSIGGNTFGILAPIATGYVIQHTGHYDFAFVIAGILLVVGATVCLTMTRHPIRTVL